METKYQLIRARFDALPIRIRLLLTFAAAMIIYLLIDLMWYGPNNSRQKALQTQIIQLDKQLIEFTNSQNEINAGIYNQRNDPKKKLLDSIEEQLVDIQLQLEQRAVNLVKPEAMAQLLRTIINSSEKLKLITLVKQAPQPLFEQTENSLKKENTVQMYRHPVTLTFSGEFADTQYFLQQLENMPQKVNFESLEYTVEEYPQSKVTLVLSTLSLNRKWIGG